MNRRGRLRTWARRVGAAAALAYGCACSGQAADPASSRPTDKEPLRFHSCDGAVFRFEGVLGRRIVANVDQWLLRVPQANPGLLEMFRLRDRQPVPNLVPWAGE